MLIAEGRVQMGLSESRVSNVECRGIKRRCKREESSRESSEGGRAFI